MNATAAARTYRIGGIQPYLMLLVLAACTAFAPFVLRHAISTRSWLELGWAAFVSRARRANARLRVFRTGPRRR